MEEGRQTVRKTGRQLGMRTHEIQIDYWKLMRPMATHETQRYY